MKRITNRAMACFSDSEWRRKWGQYCLVTSVMLNGSVLAINLYLTGLQAELQSKRYDEQYFITNEQTKNTEALQSRLLQGMSNQLVLLRRLADDRLTADERNTILTNVIELNRLSDLGRRRVVAISYLQANDLPEGVDPFKIVQGKSDSELSSLGAQYEKQSGEHMGRLKVQMVKLMDDITFWTYFHSSALALSTMILIIGSILKFPSELGSSPKSSRSGW